MSEIVFEQDGSSITIEGHTSSTIDSTETTGVLEDGQAVEITSTSTATIIEIPTTTVVTQHSNSVSKVTISTGDKGETGDTGATGAAGSDGEDGLAATISVGTTTTGTPGSNASVTNTGSTSAAILDFVIPEGQPGPDAAQDISIDNTYANSITAGYFAPTENYDDVQSFNDRLVEGFVGLSTTSTLGITRPVAKTGHGLSVGQLVRLDGGSESGAGTYVLSQADNETNAQVDGIVTAVADANNFTLGMAGYFLIFSGLTVPATYYLSPTTPGEMTLTKPSTAGQIIKPVMRSIGSTRGQLLIDNPPELVGASIPTGGTTNQIIVKQSGTDYDIGWEELIIGKPTDAYAISNTEDAGTYKYFGFENKDGAWYILRKTVATNIYLYTYGASGYATGWTNRASHSYDTYENTF